jgi:hypothetical protein
MPDANILSTYSAPDEKVPKKVAQGLRKAAGNEDDASDCKRHFPPKSGGLGRGRAGSERLTGRQESPAG